VAVEGVVRGRPPSMVNPHMATGQIEVQARRWPCLPAARTLPFPDRRAHDAREELRFKYRFLDLRSFGMQRRIRLRTT